MFGPLSKLHLINNVQKKQLILTILNSTATKRETKNYFIKYQPRSDEGLLDLKRSPLSQDGYDGKRNGGVPYKMMNDITTGIEEEEIGGTGSIAEVTQPILRISIIKIRNLLKIPRDTLKSIGVTVLKLMKLGVSPVVIIDNHDLGHILKNSSYQRNDAKHGISYDNAHSLTFQQVEENLDEQYYLLLDIIENSVRNLYLENEHVDGDFPNLLPNKSISAIPMKSMFEIDSKNGVHLSFPQLIVDHLHQGDVPIIYPIGYLAKECKNRIIPSNLLVENVALNLYHHYKNSIKGGLFEDNMNNLLSIEKVIFIDPQGGIPSLERMTSSHVLVNLRQEFYTISRELEKGFLKPLEKRIHLQNLECLNNILQQLPDSAAAIITTPQLAAIDDLPLLASATTASKKEAVKPVKISDTYKKGYSYSKTFQTSTNQTADNADDLVHNSVINQQGEAVNSFRVKNPIIYNILTDRPLISPSLPVYLRKTPLLSTTILRKGIDVQHFQSFSTEEGLDLIEMDKQGTISLKKLKGLIDDSFKKPLDLQHYLERVNKKVAGLIIAGDYEGGAIITWESLHTNKTKIPYLDKFAVKRSVQGTFSVADIVFKVMVNSLFPNELIWRSRQNNPVNKWYHERSNGSMVVSGTQWRCFWVGNRTREDENLSGYFDICKKIEPSWEKC